MITVRYSSVDGFQAKRTFKTAAAARAYAVERVGAGAEVSAFGYAISGDGVGKITAEGIGLRELLTGQKDPSTDGVFGIFCVYYQDEVGSETRLRGRFDSDEECAHAFDHARQHDCGECYHYMAEFKGGRWVRYVETYNGKTAAEIVAEAYPAGPF